MTICSAWPYPAGAHHVTSAILVLVFAALLSFVATRVVDDAASTRGLSETRARVCGRTVTNERTTLPVIWLKPRCDKRRISAGVLAHRTGGSIAIDGSGANAVGHRPRAAVRGAFKPFRARRQATRPVESRRFRAAAGRRTAHRPGHYAIEVELDTLEGCATRRKEARIGRILRRSGRSAPRCKSPMSRSPVGDLADTLVQTLNRPSRRHRPVSV